MRPATCAVLVSAALAAPVRAEAREVGYAEALALAGTHAPDLVAVRAKEDIGRADVRVAGIVPNPTLTVGTSTELARLSADLSLPVSVFGQRDAAIDAATAGLAVLRADTRAMQNDSRWSAAKAFVTLWAAERIAEERHDAAELAAKTETAVTGRVETGSAPELDRTRAHAERLRADADAQLADAEVEAAAFELARLIGGDAIGLRALGDPDVPATPPSLESLRGNVPASPLLARDRLDVLAGRTRADYQRALARPVLVFSGGIGAFDPTIPGNRPDFHASIGLQLPLFNLNGPNVDHERAVAVAAEARRSADALQLESALGAAYRVFVATALRVTTLETSVVPAVDATASASRDAYMLGHSPFLVMLEALRARVENKIQLVLAKVDRASSWIDIEHIVGKI